MTTLIGFVWKCVVAIESERREEEEKEVKSSAAYCHAKQ